MADFSLGVYEVINLTKIPFTPGPNTTTESKYNATLTAESGSQMLLQNLGAKVTLFATGEVNLGEKYEVILRTVK